MTKRHANSSLQQVAYRKKITKRTRHRKSSLQTMLHSRRSQAQIHLSRAMSFHHLILLFKNRPIRTPYRAVDLASGHILLLVDSQFRSHMDSPSGLTLRLDYLKCHRLIVRPHWPAGCPLSLSVTVQTCDKTVSTVLAVFDKIEAADRRDVRG